MIINKTINWLAAAMVAVFCGSIANAQIIYSNNFLLGTGINISNTPPTVANSYAGGDAAAVWLDVNGSATTHGLLLDNGINTSIQSDYWALKFTPQDGHVYLLTVVLGFTNNPGIAPEFGYSINTTLTNYNGDPRFNGGVNGYDWMAPTYSSGNPQFFAGNKTANVLLSANNVIPAGTPGTNTFQIILDTRGVLGPTTTNWVAAGCINGVGVNGTYAYSGALQAQVRTITSVGISQNGTATDPSSIQYQSFVLETTFAPFTVKQPTPVLTLSGGGTYSNSVAVLADTNGGTLSYQWYANGAPLANGGGVSGANTNVLIISPLSAADQFTNYYVVVTNNYGSTTSSLASLIVLTNPVVTAPVNPSNSITLFGGTGGYVGSSPVISVTAGGAPPLIYQWLTNGVPIGGATNSSLLFTNSQLDGPTNFACVVTNIFGAVTSTWFATYVATPTAAYPQAVLADQPLDFWRLNEPDDTNGNKGAVCHDYQSGANGVYTNVTLGQAGYNALEPTETSMFVTSGGPQPSCVSGIVNVDLAATMTNGVNAAFAAEAWANCLSGNGASGGAPVVSQGTNGGCEFFLGVDTNSVTKHYEFYVRSANGTLYSADDTTIQANDVNWHYLVGVCDQAHTNISLYIDGQLVASAYIPANSGIYASGRPVAIGAGIRPASANYDVPFTGNIDDVAIYTHALSAGQVVLHFTATGGSVPVAVLPPLPPATAVYQTDHALTIPATVSGSPPLGYYWTNLTAGGVLGSGATSTAGSLDATLTIPNVPAGMNGDQLELVVTNASSSTTALVTLFTPAPPVALDYANSILYSNNFNGGTWSIAGLAPTVANVLVGGTNSLWIDSRGTNDNGVMQANGTPTSSSQNSWVLPFTPHAGYVYTISATVTFTGNPGNWIALGFIQNLETNATDGRINGGAPGIDWLLVQQSGGVQYFKGPSGSGTILNSAIATPGNVTHTITIVLDTTGAQWTCHAVVDGTTTSTGTYSPNPTIRGVGIAQNGPGAPYYITWNTFMLTQVAPGGVPPYLLNPLPPTSIVLTNGTVTVPATAFGSAPFGYYWDNNAAVIASGATNNMAPLPADLSVSSSSLIPGQLNLVLTNAYGTNVTLITLINSNPGTIQFSNSVPGNLLTLSWPTNFGWTLQAQTNSLSVGIGTNWVNVANSSTTNQVIVPVNTTNGSVFYRLVYP